MRHKKPRRKGSCHGSCICSKGSFPDSENWRVCRVYAVYGHSVKRVKHMAFGINQAWV